MANGNITVAILSAYGDESYDDKKQRVYAIGSVVGTREQWMPFVNQWYGLTEGKPVHATDLQSPWALGNLKSDIQQKADQRLYASLIKLIANSGMAGFAVALNLQDYRAAFPRDPDEHPYFWCFLETMKHYREFVAAMMNQPNIVEFTFERKLEIEFNATLLYSYYCQQPEWSKFIGDKVGYASREKEIPLQAADFVAREWMKNIDSHIGPEYRVPRLSLRALLKSLRFVFRYYNARSFAAMRQKMMKLGELHSLQDYDEWRVKNNVLDNATNRIRFFAELDPVKTYGVSYLKAEDL